jgi:hypothetical protein
MNKIIRINTITKTRKKTDTNALVFDFNFRHFSHPREIGFTFHGVNFRHFLKENLPFSLRLKREDIVNKLIN